MSVSSFFAGIEGFAAKTETELNALLTEVGAVKTALEASNTAGSLVITNAIVALTAAETFLKLAITDSAPIVAALQAAVSALEPKS
jgi:hypothetical protein